MQSKKFNKSKIATAVSVCIYASAINLGTMVELARAQTTNTSTDIYTAALAAIQSFGYQPATGIQAATPINTMVATAFDGGALLGGTMTFDTNEGTAGDADMTSWYICNNGTDSASFTFSGSILYSDSTQITSSTSTNNTSSTFQNGTSTLTLSYTPPNTTGGTSTSGTQTYNYGTTNTVTTNSGTSTGTGTTNSVTTTWSGTVTVPGGMAQLITTSVSTSTVNSDPYTAPATLSSPTSSPLVSVTYTESFANTIKPTLYATIQGVGTNLWASTSSVVSWTGNANEGTYFSLSSPNGAYGFSNGYGGYLGGWAMNTTSGPYGWWYSGYDTGGNVELIFNDTGAPGALYTTDGGTTTYWSAGTWSTDAAYVGVDNTGALSVFDLSFNQLWTTGAGPSSSQPSNTLSAPYTPTVADLMNGNPDLFYVNGDYSAVTYSSTGKVTYGGQVPASSVNCSAPSGFSYPQQSKTQDKQTLAQVDQSGKSGTQTNIVSNLLSWSGLVKDAVASDATDRNDPNRRDQRYRTDEVTGSTESTRSNKGSMTRENKSNDLNGGSDGKKFVTKEITKPFYLKTNQFASTSDPVASKLRIKITPIPGKHLTNEVTFSPGPLEEIQNPKRTTTFKVKKNKKFTSKVGRG